MKNPPYQRDRKGMLRTLTPSVQVRILVPQPTQISDLPSEISTTSSGYVESRPVHRTQNIPSRLGGMIVAAAVVLDFSIVDSITDHHREYPAQIVLAMCEDD